ncbi:MAG: hypothetical protein H6719_15960 [Sandaracinaceae bacterium]|nr:hypothetical protein [Sandaracinaceae bacterium]
MKWLVLLFCVLLASPAPALAQGARARRAVSAGEVTGLEMRIEGSLRAPPGGTVRWFVTLYEVVRRRDLRPAPGATLRVMTSNARGEPVQVVQTDADGHASIEIPFPDDLEAAPSVRVEASSPRNVRRVFSVGLSLAPLHRVEVYVDRARTVPGATVAAFGRVLSVATGRPIAEETVTVRVQDRHPLGAPIEVTTDARGVFSVPSLTMPDAPTTTLQIVAATEHGNASQGVLLDRPTPLARWVEATAPPLVQPGQRFDVAVHVRGRDGEPVRGARVRWEDAEEDEDEPPLATDAEGRVSIAWTAPTTLAEPWRSLGRTLLVTDPGTGAVRTVVSTRVARVPALVAWAVDGGALAPGLDGRVFVRVVRPDGAPYRGAVSLEMARLGGTRTATTDADGVAVFEGPVALGGDHGECGGSTATEATLVVDAHRERLCLPIDPDATVRVERARFEGDGVVVELSRAAAVRAASVEVAVLERSNDGWTPVARAHAAPRDASVTLRLPPSVRGELWVRARPLLDDGIPVRGGSRLVYRPFADGDVPALEASEARGAVTTATDATFAIFADETDELRRVLQMRLGPVGAALEAARSEAFVAGLLAARTPPDTSASMTLREGARVPQPMPSNPVAEGLLRDPWRTRARFVRGRLGRLMRSVEEYVDGSIPDTIDDVGVREGGRWRFNRALLTPAIEGRGLGEETATGLDGEPLDIDVLTALDPSFTYDHVARRITRQRLWRVLVVLRNAIQTLGLDLPWARRGDEEELLLSVFEIQDQLSGSSEYLSREHLFDAWGQPFVLRRVRGRPRFRFLEPVEGWELVSPGPDGRPGTGDDVVDPFARVLPSGGIYAEAVGEDILLARLSGVALGRATLESLAAVFSVEAPESAGEPSASAHATWGTLPGAPTRVEARPPALEPIAASIGGLGATPTWSPPSARRAYVATAVRFGADGGLSTAEARFVAGAPWIASLELPAALRPSEAIRLPIELVRLAEAPTPTVEASVRGRAIEASVEGTQLVLRATQPGIAVVTVTVRAQERVVSRFERRVRVVPEGLLRQRARALRVAREADLTTRAPDDARPWRSELVVGTPRALYADPAFVTTRAEAPGLLAWARAMAEGEPDEDLLARATGDEGVLATACSMVAWAADESYASRVSGAATTVRAGLGDDLALRASVLAALAPWAPDIPGGVDPSSTLVNELREDGWRALASASDAPAVMARMAAGLLLADRDDSRGRALLERARATLVEDGSGRRWVPGDSARIADGWIGTLALAVAARQIGEDALADELADAALTRLYLADRAGTEGAFWALAASVYGALGVEGPDAVDVEVGGATQHLALTGGVARIAIDPSAAVQLRTEAPVWARVEARYLAPLTARDEGPLRAHVEGTPGRAGETAGFELVVENASDASSGHPVVELVLPGAAALDAEAIRRLERSEDVLEVTPPDGAGVVRVRLAELAEGGERRVPLAWRWIGAGQTQGLGLVAYDASSPHAMFVREGRTLTIEEAR